MTVEISVIIPNWNGRQWLAKCLASITKSTFQSYETIVVDNGSTDGTEAWLRQNYPAVRLISLGRNYGFAKACNQGILAARAPLICLLNNDIEVSPEWLSELKSGMDRYPNCGMATSRMHFLDEPEVIYNTGDNFKAWCSGGARGMGQRDCGQYNQEEFVFGACAGAGIYRRVLFERIGLFDEDFFIFSEDVDLNLRAQYAGFACVYLPTARVFHVGTATVGFHSDRHVFLFSRNDLFVLLKNMSLKNFVRYLALIVHKRIELIWMTAKAGQGRIVFFGYLSFFRNFLKMLRKRSIARTHNELSYENFKRYILVE